MVRPHIDWSEEEVVAITVCSKRVNCEISHWLGREPNILYKGMKKAWNWKDSMEFPHFPWDPPVSLGFKILIKRTFVRYQLMGRRWYLWSSALINLPNLIKWVSSDYEYLMFLFDFLSRKIIENFFYVFWCGPISNQTKIEFGSSSSSVKWVFLTRRVLWLLCISTSSVATSRVFDEMPQPKIKSSLPCPPYDPNLKYNVLTVISSYGNKVYWSLRHESL